MEHAHQRSGQSPENALIHQWSCAEPEVGLDDVGSFQLKTFYDSMTHFKIQAMSIWHLLHKTVNTAAMKSLHCIMNKVVIRSKHCTGWPPSHTENSQYKPQVIAVLAKAS